MPLCCMPLCVWFPITPPTLTLTPFTLLAPLRTLFSAPPPTFLLYTVLLHRFPRSRPFSSSELDLTVCLSEGAVAHIAKSLARNPDPTTAPSLVGTFVGSALTWGVHVASGSPHRDGAALGTETYGISRFGSGSHLMSSVRARALGVPADDLKFHIVHNMPGAAEALPDPTNPAEVFLWNKSTTQPLVDTGVFRRVGTFDSPWPAFVVVARPGVVATAEQQARVRAVLAVVRRHCALLRPADTPPGTPAPREVNAMVAQRYGLREDTVDGWFRGVQWVCEPRVSAVVLDRILDALIDVNIIERFEAVPLRSPSARLLCPQVCHLDLGTAEPSSERAARATGGGTMAMLYAGGNDDIKARL